MSPLVCIIVLMVSRTQQEETEMKYVNLIANANREIANERKVIEDLDAMQIECAKATDTNGYWLSSTYPMWAMIEQLACNTEKRIVVHERRLMGYFKSI